MHPNEALIHKFYTSFQTKDYKGMQECYTDDATFSDSVFKNLNSKEVKAMWEMLLKGSKDMQLSFSEVKADDKSGSCNWVATYTFSLSGNKVINPIHAEFTFKDGKIATHRDSFDFFKWSKQAFGCKGVLLGWTSFFHNKIQQASRAKLDAFMGR
ncbi:MAG: nuclear transport factor 2 family protein [Flavobacteriales bacterium]